MHLVLSKQTFHADGIWIWLFQTERNCRGALTKGKLASSGFGTAKNLLEKVFLPPMTDPCASADAVLGAEHPSLPGKERVLRAFAIACCVPVPQRGSAGLNITGVELRTCFISIIYSLDWHAAQKNHAPYNINMFKMSLMILLTCPHP